MSSGTWSPAQYLKFEDERTRPARDLLAAVPTRDPKSVVDLGCGPGNSTEVLVERYPGAAVAGIDSSDAMIAEARRRLPAAKFAVADIATWRPEEPCELIFANAVLQWLPDHATLLPALARSLAPGGSLAVQMPDNLDEPSHRAMREAAGAGPWAERLASAGADRSKVASATDYYRLLKPLSARVDIWRTTYYHPLAGAEAIVEWLKGTGLRPYLRRLLPEEQLDFLARYTELIRQTYPADAEGTVLLAFPRLFIVAVRRSG
jgi:trans-aconitate 2-methyltransferase